MTQNLTKISSFLTWIYIDKIKWVSYDQFPSYPSLTENLNSRCELNPKKKQFIILNIIINGPPVLIPLYLLHYFIILYASWPHLNKIHFIFPYPSKFYSHQLCPDTHSNILTTSEENWDFTIKKNQEFQLYQYFSSYVYE